MKTFEEFKTHFNENVKAQLEGLETRRKATFKRKWQLALVAFTLLALNIMGVLLGSLNPFTLFLTVLAFPAAAIFFYRKHFTDKTIASDYKEEVVRKMLEYLDPSLSYNAEGHINYETFEKSQLFFMRPDFFGGDDHISGSIDGIPLEISELNVTYKPLDSKRTKDQWKTIFLGIFMVAEYPRYFVGRTFILPDKLIKQMGFAGELVQRNNLYRGKFVRPDHDKFRDNFAVYADNEVQGEQLLTHELMDKMLLLKKKSKADVYASFIDNNIYVGIDLNREIFKVDTNRPLYNTSFIKEFYDEMIYIFSIVEDLNIDEMELHSTTEAPAEEPNQPNIEDDEAFGHEPD